MTMNTYESNSTHEIDPLPGPLPTGAVGLSPAATSQPSGGSALAVLRDYVSIARPDHWFKNGFMVIGIVLAAFYQPAVVHTLSWGKLILAFVATCLVASSNYVVNEILDAPSDLSHPVKCRRPIPAGRIRLPLAYAEWLALMVIGAGLAWLVNPPFFFSALLLLVMGIVYNVRPVRSKEVPYVDVLSESVNNPIRLALGWFAVTPAAVPPLSLVFSYWLVGAFFMASKRFAEYRSIGDPQRAAAYRSSFRHYDDDRLLISMFFYATASALFLGVFIIRYHLELILAVPLVAGFFSAYLRVTLKPESPAQAPERLYRERGLMLYLTLCIVVFVGLMFVHISPLYRWFNVEPSTLPTLWHF
jgi:4-hydroxybenzoate polyprenyltransferase